MIAVAAVYWPGLHGPWILDDSTNLEPIIALAEGWLSPTDALLDKHLTVFGRPLAHFSFAFDALVWGTDPAIFRGINLLIHLLCGLLVFRIARLLAARDRSLQAVASWVAIGVAACWLSAPMLVSTVLYVVQRMAQLSTLFALLGMLLFIEGRNRLERQQSGARWHLFAGVPLCLMLGLQSKENIVVLPALLLLLEVFYFSVRSQPKPQLRVVLLFFVLTALLPVVAGIAYLTLHPDLVTGSYLNRDFTLTERLLTELRVLWDYVSVLLLPNGAKMGLVHDDFPLSTGWLSPATTLLAALSWVGIVCFTVLRFGRRRPSIAFGVIFFLVAHGLESTFLPLEIYFEHRNYLPAVGLYLALIAGLTGLVSYLPRGGALLKLLAIVIIPAFLLATFARARSWGEPTVNLLAALEHHPDSPRLLSGAAELLAANGQTNVALQLTHRAERVAPRQQAALLILGIRIYCLADIRPSPALYTSLRQLQAPVISEQLGYQFQKLVRMTGAGRCPQLDRPAISAIISHWLERGVKPNTQQVLSIMRDNGELLVIDGREPAALIQFENLVEMAPYDPLGRFLLAGQLQKLEQNEAAIQEFLYGESLLTTDSRKFEAMRYVLRYRLGMPPYFAVNEPVMHRSTID